MAPLSEAADNVRLLLNLMGAPACVLCIARRTHLKEHEVREAIRELIRHGGTMADFGDCSVCHKRTLVAVLRPKPFERKRA